MPQRSEATTASRADFTNPPHLLISRADLRKSIAALEEVRSSVFGRSPDPAAKHTPIAVDATSEILPSSLVDNLESDFGSGFSSGGVLSSQGM